MKVAHLHFFLVIVSFLHFFCYFFFNAGHLYNAHLISFGIGGSLFSFFAALVFLLAALFADLLMFPVMSLLFLNCSYN